MSASGLDPPQARATPPGWQLRLAGAPTLQRPDGSCCLLDRHGALLAARLVLDGPQPRNGLAAWLWPDLPVARALANLRQRLLRLRQQCGIDLLQGARLLELAPEVAVQPWQGVADGELLAGVEAVAEPDLADWLTARRRALRVQRADACQRAWQAAMAAGHWRAALDAAAAWRTLESAAEAPALALARTHHRQGDAAAAAAVLQDMAGRQQAEFGVAPGSEARALLALLQRTQVLDAAAVAPPATALADALWHPPRLVGRDGDLAVLAAAWSAQQVAWVAGEAGCGSTRLLRQFARGLARQGAVWVSAEPGDAAVPGRLLQRLADALGLAQLPSQPPAGLGGWVIDALHLADDHSLAGLTALAAAWPLPLALGSRPPAAHARLAALAQALGAARRLVLHPPAPWTAADVDDLLRDLAWPVATEAGLAQRLCAHTGGHPRHLLDSLRALHAAPGAPGDTLPLPAAALHELAQRLQRLPPEALALLRLLTVAGPGTEAQALASLLGCDLAALAGRWQALAAAALLGADGRPHGLALAAARATLPAPVAAAWHRALAEQAEQAEQAEPGADADADADAAARIAGHWLAAGVPLRAVPWLLRAADAARAALRPADEARHLGQAADALAGDDPAQAVDLLLRLARVEVEARGIGAAAAPLARALALAGDGATRARVLLLTAQAELNALRPATSADAAAQALAAVPAGTPAAAEAVLRLHKAWCLAGRAGAAEALWQQHAGWLHGDLLPDAEAVSDRGWVLDRLGQVAAARDWHRRGLDRARREGRPVDEAVVLGNLAQSQVMAGEPTAAEAVLDQLDDRARRHAGLHSASDYSLVTRASAAAIAGDPARALQLFDQALADAALQSAAAQAAIRVRRARLWGTIGQTARALTDAEAALRTDPLPDWTRLHARWLLAWQGRQPASKRQAALVAVLADADARQLALYGGMHLQLAHLRALEGAPDVAAVALADARRWRRQARMGGHAGLVWTAHWVAAAAALAAGRPWVARRHLHACLARPAREVAPDLPPGVWWHGLWRVALALDAADAARAAHHAGCAWVLQRQAALPAPLRPSFVAAVPAHQALLAARPGAG